MIPSYGDTQIKENKLISSLPPRYQNSGAFKHQNLPLIPSSMRKHKNMSISYSGCKQCFQMVGIKYSVPECWRMSPGHRRKVTDVT